MAKKKELSEKQKRYCEEYLIELNSTKAARKAGYIGAEKAGYRLERDPRCRAYIDARLKEKETELIADQDEVLKYLTSVLRRKEKDSVVVTLTEKNDDYVTDDVTGRKRKVTTVTEKPVAVEVPTMIKDSNKAAELLGKAYGLYTEKIEADVDMDLNITIDYGDDEE